MYSKSISRDRQSSVAHVGALAVAAVVVFAVVATLVVWQQGRVTPDEHSATARFTQLTPWSSVGGCGAGGSGGGGGGVKWIGMGVSGGLIDVEVMYTATIGQNYNQKTVKTRLSAKPTYTTGLGLSVPVMSKSGNHQPQANEPPRTEMTGGLGDLSLDWSKSFGMSGQYSLSLALTMPTGQYYIKRGQERMKQYLSSSLQKGSGLWGTSLGLSYSKDVQDGILMFDASYSHSFAINFSGKNRFIVDSADYYYELIPELERMDDEQRSRFEYVFKPYGENDLGAYTPPSLSFSAYFGYRGIENYVHSWGITFSAPLGVAWIPGFSASDYDPFPDPDHKAWSGSFNYGLEFTKPKYPIFVAVSLPIHDRSNPANKDDPYDQEPFKKWDAPDWNDFLQSWTVGLGVKSTMF